MGYGVPVDRMEPQHGGYVWYSPIRFYQFWGLYMFIIVYICNQSGLNIGFGCTHVFFLYAYIYIHTRFWWFELLSQNVFRIVIVVWTVFPTWNHHHHHHHHHRHGHGHGHGRAVFFLVPPPIRRCVQSFRWPMDRWWPVWLGHMLTLRGSIGSLMAEMKKCRPERWPGRGDFDRLCLKIGDLKIGWSIIIFLSILAISMIFWGLLPMVLVQTWGF